MARRYWWDNVRKEEIKDFPAPLQHLLRTLEYQIAKVIYGVAVPVPSLDVLSALIEQAKGAKLRVVMMPETSHVEGPKQVLVGVQVGDGVYMHNREKIRFRSFAAKEKAFDKADRGAIDVGDASVHEALVQTPQHWLVSPGWAATFYGVRDQPIYNDDYEDLRLPKIKRKLPQAEAYRLDDYETSIYGERLAYTEGGAVPFDFSAERRAAFRATWSKAQFWLAERTGYYH